MGIELDGLMACHMLGAKQTSVPIRRPLITWQVVMKEHITMLISNPKFCLAKCKKDTDFISTVE